LLPKSKSVSPDDLRDNEDLEDDVSVLPGSMGCESESLLSLQTPKSSLAPVKEQRSMDYANSSDGETDNDRDAILHGIPKSHFPLSSMHSQSTPHLFGSIDNFPRVHNTKIRTSVPSIGIDTETESDFGSNRGMSEHSLNNCSDCEDSQMESDLEFDGDVLSLLDGNSAMMSPTIASAQSTPRRSATLSINNSRQRKSSSFKRDCPGRQAIAKRTVSLHIPRNNDAVATKRKYLCKTDSNLSSSLSQLQRYELSPSPESLDRYASSYSDRPYSSENSSPWSTPLHKIKYHQAPPDMAHFHHKVGDDDMTVLTDPDNESLDNVLVSNDDTNAVTNERLCSSSTSVSDGTPDGEEKAAREQNMTENDKEMTLENQIRRELKKVDSIGEKLYSWYDGDDATKSASTPTSEDGISVHEVKLDIRSLSPLSEISIEDTCGKNLPYHSSSNSTSSAEIHFIHKQHDSTASEQSMDSQNRSINHDQPALHSSIPDPVPPSPQRYRRLLAITPSLQKLSLSQSTSDVSTDVKPKEKHPSGSPKGNGFKFSLKRKNSLVLPDGKEKENSRSLSLSRDKSKSTNELYSAKEKGWAAGIFSGIPKFRKSKSNGRSKQFEVVTSSSHSTSPKPKRKKSRAPQYV